MQYLTAHDLHTNAGNGFAATSAWRQRCSHRAPTSHGRSVGVQKACAARWEAHCSRALLTTQALLRAWWRSISCQVSRSMQLRSPVVCVEVRPTVCGADTCKMHPLVNFQLRPLVSLRSRRSECAAMTRPSPSPASATVQNLAHSW